MGRINKLQEEHLEGRALWRTEINVTMEVVTERDISGPIIVSDSGSDGDL